MKINWVSALASFVLVAVIGIVVIIFQTKTHDQYFKTRDFNIFIIFTLTLILVLNYYILEFLFNYNSKKQIRRIKKILPDNIVLDHEPDLSLRELGERVSLMSSKNDVEMDMMKEMEHFRKEYVGNVSHELKTPLFSIQGYVATLLDGGVEDLNVRDKYLQRIENSVERLLNIVQDLDMINRFEAGQIELNLTSFDINALIEEVFDLLDLEADRHQMKLELQTTQKKLMVHADKNKISQVFTNLISNAIKYANREGAHINVTTKEEAMHVVIIVEDNGMGIRPENLARIFERFYRVESSRNRKDGGSGLGLAIVKHILEAHHQNITVESAYLSGTKFKFRLEKIAL
ncbi:sensor histidine kinase [Chryseobacterium sp. POL2]|uniref:sensor histidine kinase n=1 Tax=Chryseobacterium sp. POL2 TaxID=2713414 RepID=UPI0013E121EE|nr:ATP-binding protein [Chryseobacterium sp. POL2]QIG90689.1 GHKL domain-containing protein [Chryseobacterium sp. POL2]